jgi:hypothetical protein
MRSPSITMSSALRASRTAALVVSLFALGLAPGCDRSECVPLCEKELDADCGFLRPQGCVAFCEKVGSALSSRGCADELEAFFACRNLAADVCRLDICDAEQNAAAACFEAYCEQNPGAC